MCIQSTSDKDQRGSVTNIYGTPYHNTWCNAAMASYSKLKITLFSSEPLHYHSTVILPQAKSGFVTEAWLPYATGLMEDVDTGENSEDQTI